MYENSSIYFEFLPTFIRYQQSADNLLISISKRIVSSTHEEKMKQVLTSLSPLLKANTAETVKKNINYNKNFQRGVKTSAIKSYLQDYLSKLEGSEHNWRLPETSVPISYNLHLKTNIHIDDLSVEGEVSINLKVLKSTDKLTLHSRNLKINELKLFEVSSSNEVDVLSFSLYAPTDMLTIYLAEDATVGVELLLNVKFNFDINTKPDMTGFYRTSYVNEENENR